MMIDSDSEAVVAAVTMHPRVDLLKLLAKSYCNPYRLMKELGLTARECYNHLKVLEEVGLMEGRFRYRITDRGREILSVIENRSE